MVPVNAPHVGVESGGFEEPKRNSEPVFSWDMSSCATVGLSDTDFCRALSDGPNRPPTMLPSNRGEIEETDPVSRIEKRVEREAQR